MQVDLLVPKGNGFLWIFRFHKDDFSYDVYTSLDGCLSCKACAKACPVNVDVSQLKAEFLHRYHTRYRRPIRDFLIGYIEQSLVYLRFLENGLNWLLHNPVMTFINSISGLYDLPRFQVMKQKDIKKLENVHLITWGNIDRYKTINIIIEGISGLPFFL